ncbi:hypothetical protein COW86_02850 [Candidatus Kuenenbacteria bacterium CG22_combo_CG10-13_8_21_14_all_39_9]|uniref:DUF3006 domain-containing protein n=1 Tax=Candidatus Kuenenbacteria bacterium CG22_combo_CG10-13_8_21_14_all_39_9 TaxID=1974621 RepID=A0A2H0D0C3_9BACT|nr:MAG: hypothetical protein COW86_02850 [Candidatus Kuenenbacteria bacterium CG22_combo_CG10-13_8_21_14_all_39_9]
MDNLMDTRKYLLATVDRLEGGKAVLKLDDGQSLDWPVDKLPAETVEGTQLKLWLLSDKGEEEEREKMAKAVLNEILKIDK